MLKKLWRRPMFKLTILVAFISCLGLASMGASPMLGFRTKSQADVDLATLRQRAAFAAVQQGNSVANNANKEQVTPVQEGVLTDKEKRHSKIFEKQYEWRKGKKLRDLPGTVEIEVRLLQPTIPDDPNAPTVTATDFLRKMSCRADAVVIGTIQSEASQLTEDGKFAFSEYRLHVNEIFKNTDGATGPIRVNSDLEITRPGGAIRLNGRVVRVVDESFPRFDINGQYLVFLSFIQETGSYKPVRQGDYELVGDRFSALNGEGLPIELRNGGNRSSLQELLRNAISIGCN